MFGLATCLESTGFTYTDLADYVNRYNFLKSKGVPLDFLQIGSCLGAYEHLIPKEMPLVIYGDWLLDSRGCRQKLFLNDRLSWRFYKKIVNDYKVLNFCLRSPLISAESNRLDLQKVISKRQELEQYLGVSVSIEVGFKSKVLSWNSLKTLKEFKAVNSLNLCLNLGILNLEFLGNREALRDCLAELLARTSLWHFAYNSGYIMDNKKVPEKWLLEILNLKKPEDLLKWAFDKLTLYVDEPEHWPILDKNEKIYTL